MKNEWIFLVEIIGLCMMEELKFKILIKDFDFKIIDERFRIQNPHIRIPCGKIIEPFLIKHD